MAYDNVSEAEAGVDVRALLGSVWRRRYRIVFVTLLLLIATYALLLFTPKVYESSASILVEPRSNAYTRAATDQTTATTVIDPSTISSQIELAQSRDTLLSVVRSENLIAVPEFNGSEDTSLLGKLLTLAGKPPAARAPTEEVALANLQDRLSVIRERDSLVISVLVRSEDPVLAARLANALANAHVQRRAQLSLSDTAEASVWLEQQIDALRKRVTDAETKVAQFRVNNDLYTGTNNTSLLDQQLSEVAGQITAAQERKNTAQSRANLIRGLISGGQPIDSVPDVRDSPAVQQLTQQKADLQGQRAQLLATLLPNHPNVQALSAQIAEIDKQIKIEGQNVAKALEAEAKIEGDLETSLQTELTRLKQTASTATTDAVTLDELQREAKAERDLLESYLLRYRDAVARTDTNSALPDVRVITLAAPSNAPASPKTTLIMIAVAIVALALQIGSILFGELLSGRALVERRVVHRGEPVERIQVTERITPEPEMVEPIVATPVMPAAAAVLPPAVVEPEVKQPLAVVTALEPVAKRRFGVFGRRRNKPLPTTSEAVEMTAVPVAAEPRGTQEPLVASTVAAEPVRTTPEVPVLLVDERAGGERITQGPDDITTLSAEIALGRARVVFVAAVNSVVDSAAATERLVGDALRRGLSVARVDAGSGHAGNLPGLTDLSADKVGFGEIVHKTSSDGLAEVPWGQLPALNRRSLKLVTLLEALSDIYESVIVNTGRIGLTSPLPAFAGTDCLLALIVGPGVPADQVMAAEADAAALGFSRIETIVLSKPQTEVA